MNHERAIHQLRQRRKFRVRKRLCGDSERPRLSVFRSHKHMYAQVVDDQSRRTLVSASTCESGSPYGGNVVAASAVGKAIAERSLKAGIKQVCFDRGRFKYHGRVAAVAEAAREAGLSL